MSIPLLTKTAISCGVPVILKHAPDVIKALWCRFFAPKIIEKKIPPQFVKPIELDNTNYIPAAPPQKRIQRKVPDTTKLSKYHWDYVMEMYQIWRADCDDPNTKSKKQYEVVERLNLRMRMDKSRTFYTSIFNGTLKRSDCSDEPLNFNNTLF